MKLFQKICSLLLTAVFAVLPYLSIMPALQLSANAERWEWDGLTEPFERGTGSEEDPYIIASASQLAYFAASVNAGNDYSNKYLVLATDICLEELDWTPIGCSESKPFRGSFNGCNFRIDGIALNGFAGKAIGLFGYNEGVISNLIIGWEGSAETRVINLDALRSVTARRETICGGFVAGYNTGTIS